MNKTKLYILTFAVIALLCSLATMATLHYFYTQAKETLNEQKIQSGQREIRELGMLLEQQLEVGLPPEKVIANLQQSILNTDVQSEFVCMYNRSGIELCHPDPAFVGKKIDAGNSTFSNIAREQRFQQVLESGQRSSGIRAFPEKMNRSSEIVSVYPVKGTDWMLASHTNIDVMQKQLQNLYRQFLTGAIVLIVLITAGCYILIRLLYRKYELAIDLKIGGLNAEVNSLTILNKQLELRQKPEVPIVSLEEKNRKRLITYVKDEIIRIDTADIAYIVLNENIVTVLTFEGKEYTVNSSLDDLIKELDNLIFYRANRQYIINVNAIESIWIYGRNQLRIQTKPQSTAPILISKNKVAEFKKWLDR
ncbi:LytTR family transcriptional regulator [Sphingobacterium sp. UME9]|uniref:LytTR family transcriptional regulator n=1 Tax=Sphingobacterium sp. UME9 TaxID=1862316 RepID=UPI001604298F|nr:LytTR family transcriptional regulator [Sphingobacterium sp. UME9]MBB1643127.1 histidine kinase [Sphingobacterium sp. UME9]